jgi:hypothetical protein
MRETVFGLNAARFAVTNANVMYDGIGRAEPIDLLRDVPNLCGQISELLIRSQRLE